jgi:hypothetical protein
MEAVHSSEKLVSIYQTTCHLAVWRIACVILFIPHNLPVSERLTGASWEPGELVSFLSKSVVFHTASPPPCLFPPALSLIRPP